MRILRKIRKEFDYEAYCEENFTIKRTARPDEVRICCPNCGDSKFKCYVNNDKKLFNCYKCDFNSGNFDVFDFVALTEDVPRGKVILRLAHEFAPTTPLTIEEIIKRAQQTHYDVEEDEPGATSEIRTIDSLPKEASPLTDPSERKESKFWDYLLNERGMTQAEVLAAKVHYVYQSKVPIYKINGVGETKYVGNIGRRILFPVYAPGGKLVSWLSRPIREDYDGPKYVNCPDSEINRTVWPVVAPYADIAVIVEGIIDAIAVRRLGSPFSSYCTFGKSISHDQIEIFKNMGVKCVIIFWDPEERRDMARAVEDLKMHFDEVYVPRFDEWPVDEDGDYIDPGATMEYEDGEIHLEKALIDPIDVQSTEYVLWRIGS